MKASFRDGIKEKLKSFGNKITNAVKYVRSLRLDSKKISDLIEQKKIVLKDYVTKCTKELNLKNVAVVFVAIIVIVISNPFPFHVKNLFMTMLYSVLMTTLFSKSAASFSILRSIARSTSSASATSTDRYQGNEYTKELMKQFIVEAGESSAHETAKEVDLTYIKEQIPYVVIIIVCLFILDQFVQDPSKRIASKIPLPDIFRSMIGAIYNFFKNMFPNTFLPAELELPMYREDDNNQRRSMAVTYAMVFVSVIVTVLSNEIITRDDLQKRCELVFKMGEVLAKDNIKLMEGVNKSSV